MNKFSKYLWNILVAIDQMVNTLCGGDPDETLSSRMGKWVIQGEKKGLRKYIYKIANWVVELFEKDHFKKSIEEDEGSRRILK
jgi:hypothetical protein